MLSDLLDRSNVFAASAARSKADESNLYASIALRSADVSPRSPLAWPALFGIPPPPLPSAAPGAAPASPI